MRAQAGSQVQVGIQWVEWELGILTLMNFCLLVSMVLTCPVQAGRSEWAGEVDVEVEWAEVEVEGEDLVD